MPEDIMPFDYQEKKVRTVVISGDIWFVAKDICEVLGISWRGHETLSVIPETWRVVRKFRTTQKNQYGEYGTVEKELIIINEPAFYKLSFRSNKAEADRFTNWVVSEVLPVIRKTGRYSLHSEQQPKPFLPPDFDSEAKKAVGIARVFGFRGNQAYLYANRMIIKLYGIDCLDLMGHKALICEKQEHHLTPTEIGKMMGGISARKVNQKLAQAGIIESYRDGKNRPRWKATEKGKKYTVLKDTAKQHTDGTPIQQMFFLESVISFLEML